jgi:hypothetical protein
MSRGRQRALDSTLGVAEKFWDDLSTLNVTLKNLQDQLTSADRPALEPEAIREQQEELEVSAPSQKCGVTQREDAMSICGFMLSFHLSPI